jgi:ubiquitin C-terminal hydrolase
MEISDSSEALDRIESLDTKYGSCGLSAFINMGNTCYMNSALQTICANNLMISYFSDATSPFYYKKDLEHGCIVKLIKKASGASEITGEIRISEKDKKRLFKKSLSYQLKKILTYYWSINCKIKPKNFKKSLGEEANPMSIMFSGFGQNDSHECLMYILDRIHEETKTDVRISYKTSLPPYVLDYMKNLNSYNELLVTEGIDKLMLTRDFIRYRIDNIKAAAIYESLESWKTLTKNNHSIITELFAGLYYNDIVCSKCNNITFKFETNNTITLEIPDKISNPTIHDCLNLHFINTELKDDSAYDCVNCREKCIALKRMKIWNAPLKLIIAFKRFVAFNGSIGKNNKKIAFPIDNLDLNMYVSEFTNCNAIYNLYATINHSGGPNGGHYIAYAKNKTNDEWYKYNDDSITAVPKDTIVDKLVDSSTYVLCYELIPKFKSELKITPSL